MTPQAQKLRSEIEVTCYSYEGVDAIKAALRKGLEHETPQVPVSPLSTPYLPPFYHFLGWSYPHRDFLLGILVENNTDSTSNLCYEYNDK